MIIDAKELCASDIKGKGRALCIDYGDRRVGIAISDINWLISSPLTVLNSHGVYGELISIIDEYEVCLIVVGTPLPLNGDASGKQLYKVKKFISKLNDIMPNMPIITWDERQSTNGAQRVLERADISRKRFKDKIDKVAASFILEGFLSYCKTVSL